MELWNGHGISLWLTPAALPAIFLFIGFIGYRLVRSVPWISHTCYLGRRRSRWYAPGLMYWWGKQEAIYCPSNANRSHSTVGVRNRFVLWSRLWKLSRFQTSFETPGDTVCWDFFCMESCSMEEFDSAGKNRNPVGKGDVFFILLFFFLYSILLLIRVGNNR
jgi:hypothetical protein